MKFLRQFLILILGFIAITAIISGGLLVYDQDGSTLGISYGTLSGTPFSSYLVPGLFLLIVIGFGAIYSIVVTYQHKSQYPSTIIGYAVLLILFIMIEAIMLDTFNTLQVIYLFLAGLLIVFAVLIRNQQSTHRIQTSQTPLPAPSKKSIHHKHRHKRR